VTGGQALVSVHVKPGSKAPGLVFCPDGTLVVRVREPATEGRANEAVRKALASWLGIPKSRVSLLRGAASKHKAFAIHGISADALQRRIAAGSA
jgi:uncharacterized protein YggU (UPF0235/DUF167 family)